MKTATHSTESEISTTFRPINPVVYDQPSRPAPQPLHPRHGARMITLDPAAPRRAMSGREKHLLRLVCDGLTNKDIAQNLGVSNETVKSELKRIFRKIEVRNRTQAAVLLVKQGMHERPS